MINAAEAQSIVSAVFVRISFSYEGPDKPLKL